MDYRRKVKSRRENQGGKSRRAVLMLRHAFQFLGLKD
jgi:hypothetical protein